MNTEKKNRIIAVLTVDIRVPHYARIVYQVEQEFSGMGCEVVLCNTGRDVEATAHYLSAVIEQKVDGVILVGSVYSRMGREPEIETLLRRVPVVMANGELDLPNVSSVLLSDDAGAKLATEHLVAMGKRNLWYVHDQDSNSANAKRDAFLSACETLGVRGRVIETEFSVEGGRKAARELLRSCRLFDGVVCGEDETAIGVVKGLVSSGLRIPRDVAVTGYNNSIYAELCEPRLTSIDNKPEDVAHMCVKMLERMMNGEEHCETVYFRPELRQGLTT